MRFGILGPVEVADEGGRQLALGGRKQRAVLAILLLRPNEVVSSDLLVEDLWSGRPPASAATSLQAHVSRLRRALAGDQRIVTTGGGYLVRVAPGELDRERFEQLVGEGGAAVVAEDWKLASAKFREALGLWRGTPLSDFQYDSFAQAEIARLSELHIEVVEQRIEADLKLGREAGVIGELEGLVREHPLRERLRGLLMLALYRAGRQTDALATYRELSGVLLDELGLEPGEPLRTLERAILEHDPSLATPADTDRSDHADRAATLPAGTVTFLFTDIEGSTRLLDELGSERYGEELAGHRERVRNAAAAYGGVEVGTEGDAFFIVFQRASDALNAASDAQTALADGPIRVRIGVHTGEPLLVNGSYVGLDVHKAARICAAAHGGQVLVSQATRELAGDGFRDLGEYRLKDLTASERLFQLGGGDFPPLRTLRPTNLPVQPGPLLGRREELAELLTLAHASRLVTFTGPGGCGKTRLALELAASLSDEYRDGAWWVPLAAVTDPSLVLSTIAQSLGAVGELREHLAGKQVLLLLDNLEQVVECGPLIADQLAGLPGLSVLATSRERLAITFEQEYPVPPLDEATAEELFVSRARQIEPGFEPDRTVGEICRRLDRLPLALELASTRVKLMTTAQMLARIERRLDLLSKGRRDAPDRQATMRATIGWSYDLLPEDEQALFRRLGVFAGSFELEAAEGVCGADLDGLQSLVEKSLLRRDGRGRFFLLELTREYALEQLHAAREEAGLSRRHADWSLQLAKRADEHLTSPEQGRWLVRLVADTDNLRATLAWCSEHDPEGAIALATTLYRPWKMHGQLRELIPWLEGALATAATVDAHTRAVGLTTLGDALIFTEQDERAREPLEEGLALFRALGDESGEASALTLLGMTFDSQGLFAEAVDLHEESIAIARAAGDKPNLARALNNLGFCFFEVGDLARSKTATRESLAIHTELGDHGPTAADLGTLADIALAQGDHQQAERHLREALEVISSFGDERDEMYSVAQHACVAALRGDARSAGRLWAVAVATENRLGMRMLPFERARYERIVTPLQNDQAFQAGYQAGRDIDLAEAVRELRPS